MSDNPANPPRFPYIAAVLCATCLGAAAWTWMKYSYAWPIAAGDVNRDFIALMQSERAALNSKGYRWLISPELSRRAERSQPYLAVRGRITEIFVDDDDLVRGSFGRGTYLAVILPAGAARLKPGVERTYVGRLRRTALPRQFFSFLDTTASRFHPVSIGGLAVGAMGVFVFTVALRHWLGERGRFREGAGA